MMDPISLAISAVGLGMQVFGGFSQASSAREMAQSSQNVAQYEENINKVKQRQMELEGRRAQLENIRNNQRARAMATNTAVSQGAQFGTGLQGGLGQIQSQSTFNMAGVDAALTGGREIAENNSLISGERRRQASIQSDAATSQGFASLGGALVKASPIIGQVSQGFGNFNFNSNFGNYSGTPGASNTGGLY